MMIKDNIPELEDIKLRDDPRADGTVSLIYRSITQLVNDQLPTAYLSDNVDFISVIRDQTALYMNQLVHAMMSSRFYRDDDEVFITIRPTLEEFRVGSLEHQNLMLERSKAALIPHGGKCKCGYCCLYRTWIAWHGSHSEIEDIRGPMSIELFLMVSHHTERVQVSKENEDVQ